MDWSPAPTLAAARVARSKLKGPGTHPPEPAAGAASGAVLGGGALAAANTHLVSCIFNTMLAGLFKNSLFLR